MDLTALVIGGLLAALYLGSSLLRPNAARALIVLLFAGGALLNALVFLPIADEALPALVETTAVPLYRQVVALAVGVSAGGFMALVVAFETTVALLTAAGGRLAKLGLAGAALWCAAMVPVVPPHAWLGSTLAMVAVSVAAVLLMRRQPGTCWWW